ncbi:MAG: glycosyltransferase family 4 protein [Planctomycetaceae bacterium]
MSQRRIRGTQHFVRPSPMDTLEGVRPVSTEPAWKPLMKAALITAGGAGMFCGSCMQDNTLVRSLRRAGLDAVLVPTYTPITVDEEDVSTDRIFLGGINVYLDSTVPGWKRLPGWMTGWLNHPALVRWLTRFSGGTNAAHLGSLTLDMLKGRRGPQRRELIQFCDYLCNELQPDVIIFSNALLSGVMSDLRDRFSGPVLCLLQGDDIFLEGLTDRWKPSVMKQLKTNCQAFDGFLVHSNYYREFMSGYLDQPPTKFRVIPLTVDTVHDELPAESSATESKADPRRLRFGYFARICPEKGIHHLLQAASRILPDFPEAEICVAGCLPQEHQAWFQQQLQLAQQICPEQIHWLGSPPTREEKLRIIGSFDLLCVPTDYHEPKGIYVLEAGLLNVPSLLPDHGAFPELIRSLGTGHLYQPTSDHSSALATAIQELCSNSRATGQLFAVSESDETSLADRVHRDHGMDKTGQQVADLLREIVALGRTSG